MDTLPVPLALERGDQSPASGTIFGFRCLADARAMSGCGERSGSAAGSQRGKTCVHFDQHVEGIRGRRNDDRDDRATDPLHPEKIVSDLRHVAAKLTSKLGHVAAKLTAKFSQVGFRRDTACHSGPNDLGDRLGLIGTEALGLELARHRQGIECSVCHAGKVAPPACRFNALVTVKIGFRQESPDATGGKITSAGGTRFSSAWAARPMPGRRFRASSRSTPPGGIRPPAAMPPCGQAAGDPPQDPVRDRVFHVPDTGERRHRPVRAQRQVSGGHVPAGRAVASSFGQREPNGWNVNKVQSWAEV